MNLDEAQRKQVAQWIAQGLKLSEIQSRLDSELGLRLTYMEVRLLVDDLKLVPKDIEPAKPAAPLQAAPAGPASALGGRQPPAPAAPAQGALTLAVDQIARPGAVVSGKVKFSDGNSADWYFDQQGRLGLVPQKTGYRPPPADLEEFQAALDAELNKLGF
jgi:hypothetical protein